MLAQTFQSQNATKTGFQNRFSSSVAEVSVARSALLITSGVNDSVDAAAAAARSANSAFLLRPNETPKLRLLAKVAKVLAGREIGVGPVLLLLLEGDETEVGGM